MSPSSAPHPLRMSLSLATVESSPLGTPTLYLSVRRFGGAGGPAGHYLPLSPSPLHHRSSSGRLLLFQKDADASIPTTPSPSTLAARYPLALVSYPLTSSTRLFPHVRSHMCTPTCKCITSVPFTCSRCNVREMLQAPRCLIDGPAPPRRASSLAPHSTSSPDQAMVDHKQHYEPLSTVEEPAPPAYEAAPPVEDAERAHLQQRTQALAAQQPVRGAC